MADDLILDLDAFIRSVGINKSTPHAIFLGAGASISSGVPSAASCIWEWKRSIFLTKYPGLEAQFAELSLPSVRLKIQRWLDNQRKYPIDGSPEEYGFYIQECYPIAADRRAFFQEKVRHAHPHVGYKLMAKLAEAGHIDSVWTTNFDGLSAKAVGANPLTVIEVGVDCQERVPRKPNRNELLCVSLHGDYRYDPLKNTEAELQTQESALRTALIARLQHTPLVVIGHSGRDTSVMDALEDAYTQQGTGTLYWCGFGDDEISGHTRKLLEKARAAGRSAYYVPAGGFDDLLLRITLHCLEGQAVVEARKILNDQPPRPSDVRADFWLPDLATCSVIKSNAFLLVPPGEAYEFELKNWPPEKVWEYFEVCAQGKELVAVPFRTKGYAFGTIDDIRAAFGNNLGEKIERVPINDVDLRHEDTAISSLIRRAIVRAMASLAGINSDGRNLLWSSSVREQRREKNQDYTIHDAVVVYLRRIAGKNYVVLKPTIRIEGSAEGVPEDVERNLKLSMLGWQHNREFNEAVNFWRNRVLMPELEFPAGCSSPFRFQIRRTPVLARVTTADANRRIPVPEKFRIDQVGMELVEPKLVFSNPQGTGSAVDPHPVRGIVQNKPFDYALTVKQLASTIHAAVICPAREATKLNGYLQGLNRRADPGKFESDYLLSFPGFAPAFGTALSIPEPGDNLWLTCPEIDSASGPQQGALQLSSHITTCLSALKAAASPNVIIIFIPARWANWRSFETESERFDLHNFVKAFCVPQGIATQFLEEGTLTNELQCRIRWWLSLAIYAKSMRTPWVLSALDADTAFVGLGISLDRKAEKGRHVILGCSHLYNAQGEGLQFRLSKIENPVFRRRNAFMSCDDARRVGETIRQLFWESRLRLPGRVVIHKLTPFSPDERRGLQDGLSGVGEIDLLEIHMDDALRYLSSIAERDGTLKADGFPVKRGTLLKLDRDSALLWVHGVSRAVNPRLNYYQGKRRIPAPLVIRRHAGRSDLTTIGDEILGLSKMNWNSFDLYTKLPATVESSRQIARIGSLLRRFGSASYDYRLFM